MDSLKIHFKIYMKINIKNNLNQKEFIMNID